MDIAELPTSTASIPIVSAETGCILSSKSFKALLQIVIFEILLKPLRWDRVVDGCSSMLRCSGCSQVDLYPIASPAGESLASSIQSCVHATVRLNDESLKPVETNKTTSSFARGEVSKIAVIGYSGRFPDAASSEDLWRLLLEGQDVHRRVPADRFDANLYLDPTGKKKNCSQISHGCWIKNPGLFDAAFFQMSPSEALQADPAQRLALVTAYEALQVAGFVPDRTPSSQRDRVGVFYAMTSDDWREVNSGQEIGTYFIPGILKGFGYFYDDC